MPAQRATVHVLATGGSISGLGSSRLDFVEYPESGKRLGIEQLLARIPEAAEIADVRSENFIRVGSSSIGPREWLQLAQRINALFSGPQAPNGIVVTHGTATLEETAYFLNLTLGIAQPVVLVGAQRPASAAMDAQELAAAARHGAHALEQSFALQQ